MKGRLDLVTSDGIVEVKTSSRSTNSHDVDASLQLTMYSWAYRQMYGKAEETLKNVTLIKTNTPKLQITETRREEVDHEVLMALVRQVIRAVKKKVFYKNPNTRYGCRFCVYHNICQGEG